ncbi:MAG: MATE family efflux transporter [Phycisphaerales bacterium]|nr:MAG: MATE family efflux transporter [Phycisphaerales bacterium]
MCARATSAKLTSGPIGATLARLSAPMLVGILSMMAFNVVDTFFVGRLGTLPLAAMTLTFPVVMVIGTFTLGLGVGAMVVISQGIGAGDRTRIRRCSTDALTLAGVCVALLTIVGLTTLEPLFRALGATDGMLPLVEQYMIIWYPGMLCYIIPIVGNNIIRATGDTLTPSIVMLLGVAINAALDPLFIFGWGPVPALGIAGAAIATVIARGATMVVVLWVLCFRRRLLGSLWPGYHDLLASWKTILRTGLPVAVSNAIIPVALGLITRIVTGFGAEAVAGFGVATRIEGFGLALVYALSTGLSPFVGQNFGAGRIGRIQKGLFLSKMFCLAWGVLLLVLFLLFGKALATCFDSNPSVVRAASLYLWIVSLSLGLRSVHHITWTSLNVLGRPYDALFLEFLLAFGLWIPLAFIGSRLAEIGGLFGGLSLANVVGGVAAYIWVDRVVEKQRRKHEMSRLAV